MESAQHNAAMLMSYCFGAAPQRQSCNSTEWFFGRLHWDSTESFGSMGFWACVRAGTQYLDGEKGWRTSLALAALPALVLTIGSLILPETPNSLIERGHDSKARAQCHP